MKKLLALLAAFAVVGCGGSQETSTEADGGGGGGGGGSGPPVANVALPFSAGQAVKVVLNIAEVVTTETPYYVVSGQDTNGDPIQAPVPCTAAGTQCAPYTGTVCGQASVCVIRSSSTQERVMYVKNQDGATGLVVPCGVGTTAPTYSAYVVGKSAAGQISEVQALRPFTVSSTCATADAGGAASLQWVNAGLPTLVPPSIYVGLPTPNDKYTFTLTNLGRVWSRGFSLTESTCSSCSNDTTRVCTTATLADNCPAGGQVGVGKACTSNGLCAAGQTCTGTVATPGTCVAAACGGATNPPCPTGQTCTNGFCAVTCNTGLTASNLTFAAPLDATRTAALSFSARFNLDASYLLRGEPASDWVYDITGQTASPVTNTTVTLPPLP